MLRNIVLILAVAALCSALPLEDEAHVAAKETIDMLLQQGKDDSACRDLATSTIKEIKDSVDAGQKAYDAVDKGFNCHKEGQDGVKKAKEEKSKADKKYADSKTATVTACTSTVKFSSRPYNTIKENECSAFFSDPGYTSIKKKCHDAKTKEAKYSGEASAAAKALVTAEKAAEKAKAECECKTHKANEAAWTAAKKNHGANVKAWTKAHHMLCVLDDKSYGSAASKCHVPPVPEVKKKAVCQMCDGKTCSSATTALPLTNGWVAYGHSFGSPSLVIENGMCVVNGLVKSGKWGNIATLPSSCRPSKRLIFNVNNHAKTARVDVQTSGVVSWVAGGKDHSWMSLTGILFPVKP
jgi:hypothetical protein